MKKYSLHIILIISLIFLGSCTKDFEEINTNPNSPNSAEPSLLLRQVLWNSMEEMSYEGFVAGNLLGQYMTAIDFNLLLILLVLHHGTFLPSRAVNTTLH